ncbi:MAG: membrane protein insertion efficiency factor YidD [Thermoanaerobacteraceae bacterium]|nr:membrane protein insertion efficiency factor YidD [Thermoanaerobacteraceae bacterium]
MTRLLILLIKVYQHTLSKITGRTCRFHPTCSQYFITALQRFGLRKGLWLGVKRITRCHPWNEGGYDPVPKNSEGGEPAKP